MLLDDRQIEQYSRQIVLAEVGALGQARLLRARVAVAGCGIAAERVVGYLAGAGVGTIAAPVALHAVVDPAAPDLTLLTLAAPPASAAAPRDGSAEPFDAAVAAGAGDGTPPAARRTFWIAGGRAGETPPCSLCAGAALGDAAPPRLPSLADLRDALLGTIVATEVVKALLGIGTGLSGRVLSYDPDAATVTSVALTPRPSCAVCRATGAEN